MGFDTPAELIAAAGFTPVRLWDDTVPAYDLPENLVRAPRSLLGQILTPQADFRGLVIAHGCAEDVQLFAVLRELARIGRGPAYPVQFIDLLHGPGEPVTTYNGSRPSPSGPGLRSCPALQSTTRACARLSEAKTAAAVPVGDCSPAVRRGSRRCAARRR